MRCERRGRVAARLASAGTLASPALTTPAADAAADTRPAARCCGCALHTCSAPAGVAAGSSAAAAAAAFAGLPLLAGVRFPAGLPLAGDALPLLADAGVLAGVAAALACWPIATGLDTPAAFAAAASGNSKLPLRRKMLTGAGSGCGGGWGTSLQGSSSAATPVKHYSYSSWSQVHNATLQRMSGLVTEDSHSCAFLARQLQITKRHDRSNPEHGALKVQLRSLVAGDSRERMQQLGHRRCEIQGVPTDLLHKCVQHLQP